MAKFVTKDRPSLRFPGDFQIDPVAGDPPSDDETAFLAKAGATLNSLVNAIAAEDKEKLPDPIRLARRDWRSAIVSKLRGVADRFAEGLDPKAASEQFDAIEAEGAAAKPDVTIESPSDDSARFQGDIKVTTIAYGDAFLERLQRLVDYLAKEDESDRNAKLSAAVLAARRQLRASAVDRLKLNIQWWKEGTSPQSLANNVLMTRGGYDALRDRLGRSLFTVKVIDAEGEEERKEREKEQKKQKKEQKTEQKKEQKRYAVNLKIVVEQGLPPPNDTPSREKQDLFVEINNACTVIRTVCQQIRDRAQTRFRKITWRVDAEAIRRAQHTQDEYVNKLAGIGRVGLEGPHTDLAKLALTSLKNEFVAREAGRIKNRYVRRLGLWSAFFGAIFLFAYAVTTTCAVPRAANAPAACAVVSWTWSGPASPAGACATATWAWSGPARYAPAGVCAAAASWLWWDIHNSRGWWDAHKMFLLAAAGAAIGAWISFAIRRLDLPFEELAMLEEQSLDPPFRILFVTALTLIVCLLFWNGAVNIEIGNLKTGPDFFKTNGTIAILIGVFCGLSERALATAVSGRAAAFVKGVGG